MSHRPVLLFLLLWLGPCVQASSGAPDPDGLRRLVERVAAMAEDPALGENAKGIARAKDAATEAIEADRLHLALDRLASPLEVGAGLIYRAAKTETIQDRTAFEAEWRAQGSMVADEQRLAAAAKCPGAPAHVRAIAERAANRSLRYYEAARAMAKATGPSNGLFYLGRARAQFELQAICEQLSTGLASEPPAARDLSSEMAELERRTAAEFDRPEAGTKKHRQFIALNSTIKEVLEMNEAGLYRGALFEYLDAVLQLGLIGREKGGEREALAREATALARRFDAEEVDHGIVLAYLEAAAEDLEGDETTELAAATIIVEEVVPAYAAVVGTSSKRRRAKIGADQVAITLVRWPYT